MDNCVRYVIHRLHFFKMLSKCKQDIIEQMGTDYSDETVLSLTDFISCVQSGVLCDRSDSFCFICKHYELNGTLLSQLWRRERGVEKSPCTFRCQIHNLSNKLFKMFGSDVFDIFYSQDSERLHQLRVKIQALSLKDVRFEDVFFFEMSNVYIGYGKIPSSDYRVEDCSVVTLKNLANSISLSVEGVEIPISQALTLERVMDK